MRVIVNDQADRGMGSSIACGIKASEMAAGWLIALADMPYLKTKTMRQLCNRLQQGADIVAPLFNQQRGHPVGFGRRFKKELMLLNEDVGARNIISKHQEQLELMPTCDAGVVTDIDVPLD
jgi:molybdenum cofactor cytidylyltransferase